MKFEKLMEAVINDNNQFAKEIIEEFNRQLDLMSIGGDGYGLSREIIPKVGNSIRVWQSSIATARAQTRCYD